MKRIVSVSIGSSSRNHKVVTKICGKEFLIERIGTDGSIKKAVELIEKLDGKVDVFGMGGIDLYLYGKNGRRFMLKSALPLANAAKTTPIVDGSRLKNTLERSLISYINEECSIPLKDKKVLLVCAIDRFGMAETFCKYGSQMVFGDIMFALGLPIPIRKLKNLHRLAAILMPLISHMPFKMLYPTGKEQNRTVPKFENYYNNVDIIAGDFIYIKRHLPERLDQKIIVTNTVTSEDIGDLKKRGARILITSTPEFDGRSFGTNVMEAVLVCLSGKRPEELDCKIFEELLMEAGFKHRVEYLNA